MNTLTKNENRNANETVADPRGYLSPQVNIFETKEGYVLEAEMPGVSKDGLEVTLEGNELTIVGHRQVDVEGAELVYRESRPRDFKRVFELDPAIDAGRVTAKIEQGVLRMDLPKADRVKPRKITVTG
jgi:HSP20 family protein